MIPLTKTLQIVYSHRSVHPLEVVWPGTRTGADLTTKQTFAGVRVMQPGVYHRFPRPTARVQARGARGRSQKESDS